MRRWGVSAGVILGLAAFASSAGAWGSTGHHYIAQHYSQHLPPGLDGLKSYDAVVDGHVMDPDTRKSTVPNEAPRHFIDIDWYPEFATGTLSHDRATLEAEYGAPTVLAEGVLPWAVGEVTTYLTTLFEQADYDSVALEIADLCHYVGDGHQPLHCTKNYDGQYTGNNGIHSRYESTMLNTYIVDVQTPPEVVEYFSSPVDEMFAIIQNSWNDIPTVLNGDNVAKVASGGVTTGSVYYGTLWQETQDMTEQQLSEASRLTASYVFTAWVNAGSPVVPGSTPVSVAGASVAPLLELSSNPARGTVAFRYRASVAPALDVFDARGAHVASLPASAASGTAAWNPRAAGSAAPAGIYFIQLSTPGARLVRRVAYLP
jgi:hypothetical protein